MRAIICAALLALTLSGCGLSDPYERATRPPSPVRGAPLRAAASGSATPSAVVRAYAATVVNWSAETLSAVRSRLLALATAPLRTELLTEATQQVKTRLREVSAAYSRGEIVGTLPDGPGRTLVVMSLEVAPLGGTAQALYGLYLARSEDTAAGWRIAEWRSLAAE